MKQFIAFVQKEFYHIFRDSRTMLIILGMPVVQMLLFGFAVNTEVKNIHIAVYDPSPDASTTAIVEEIKQNRYFSFEKNVHSITEIEDMMQKNELDLAVIFEPDFQENLVQSGNAQIQLIANTSDPNRGTIATNYATAIIAGHQQKMLGISQIPYEIQTEMRMMYNPEMKSSYMFVPGIMGLVLMIICTIMTSVSIIREKERGTMEVLLASPLKQGTVIFAKTIPYMVLSVINLVTIILISYFILGVPVNGNLLLLFFISFLYIFLSLSLGLMISTLVEKQMNAVIMSAMTVMIPTLILSGMIFPIENMPFILQASSYIVPARWFISAVRKIMIQGQGFSMVWIETSIIIATIVFQLGVTMLNTKKRLS